MHLTTFGQLFILFAISGILLFLGRRHIAAFMRGLGEFGAGRREAPPSGESDSLPLHKVVEDISGLNERRRNVLKLFGLAGGAFVLGKVLGPSMSFFPSEISGDTTFFQNFRVVEQDGELSFFDKRGNQILVLENDFTQKGHSRI